jgi:toxin YoeB
MKKIWSDKAWDDYLYWQTQDKKTLKKVNQLVKDIERSNFEGLGKPEALKGNLSGFWSRRIDDANRLIYRINGEFIDILSCKGHYENV